MNDDLRHLQARLASYVQDDDRTTIGSAETALILDRIETRLRGRGHEAPVDLAVLLAQVHLARYQVLPAGEDQPDLVSMVRWYRRVLRTHPERVPSDIRELFDSGEFGVEEPEFGDPDVIPDSELEAGIRQLEELAAGRNTRWQATLAAFLAAAYERWGREDDLARAISLGRSVLRNDAASVSERHAARANLAGALLDRFGRFSDRDALEEAVRLYEQGLAERGSASDRANAGMAYLTRFEVIADTADLDNAIDHSRGAVERTPDSDPSYPARVSNLAAAVRARYDDTGVEKDLDEARALAELAVWVSSPSDPARARRLSNLSAVLSTSFEKRGGSGDIDCAVEVARASTASGPDNGAAGRVSNLLLALHLRGAATGNVADLQEALGLGWAMAAAMPADHADRADILTNAAGAAMSWFDWTGDIAAITQAVDLSQDAAEAAGDNGHLGLLHANLSMHLLTRFEVTDDAADVDEAVRYAELGAAAARGPAAAIAESNLAVSLRTRYEISESPADLKRALAAARAAVNLAPPQHRDRAAYESNLGLCLWQAGQRAQALEHARAAYAHPLAVGTPSRAAYAANVARMLTDLGGPSDEIGSLWAVVGTDPTAPVPLRIEAHVVQASLPGVSPGLAAAELATAVGLLPAAAWHGVGVPSRIRRLTDWQGIGRDAAATALGPGGPGAGSALVLLDSALSQLWAREVLSAGEEERLRRTHPALATRLTQLREAMSR